ncbi:MAG: hypothetical protein ACNI27_10530 [Desulfovibrio sp.]
MKIQWELKKKRGNFRPEITYTLALEGYEKELGVNPVTVATAIPKPAENWQGHCYPDCLERKRGGSTEQGIKTLEPFYSITTPSHKVGTVSGSLRLPWREDNSYPEVEAGFKVLRDSFEAVVKSVYDSAPLEKVEELGMSTDLKKHLSSGIAAKKMLLAAGF